MFMQTWRITFQSQRPCLEQGVALILHQYVATKLLTYWQVRIGVSSIYFDKSLTKEIDIKDIKCFSYVSCISDTFWWVGIVTKVNVHKGNLKIEFLHPHGPKKSSNTAPTTVTGWMYQISDTDFEQTFKAYENHKM